MSEKTAPEQFDDALRGDSTGPRLTEREKSLRLIRVIQDDIEKEAAALDGTPFTGYHVSVRFGELMAEVQAIAKIVELMLNREVSYERAGEVGTDVDYDAADSRL